MKISTSKESPKCGAKCGKGLKVWCTYYIKMRGKSVVWGKIDNKKCGAFEKCGAKWGKIYFIKVWCKQNLQGKLRTLLQQKM